MYRKCVTVQPCQVENNHTTGIKMKTFICCLILVMCSSINTKSSVQTWDTKQSSHTLFFLSCESWVVSLQLIRAGTITGNKVLGLESPYQLDPFESLHLLQFVKETCYKHGLGLALFSQTQNLLSPFLKAPARNRSLQPLPGHPQHREAMSPWGIYLKADFPVFYIYLILI